MARRGKSQDSVRRSGLGKRNGFEKSRSSVTRQRFDHKPQLLSGRWRRRVPVRQPWQLMPSRDEQSPAPFPEVFVELDQHDVKPRSPRTRPGHFRGISDAGADVVFFDARVVFQDLGIRPAARQKVEDQGYPNPMPLDAWQPEANIRVYRDAGENLITCHVRASTRVIHCESGRFLLSRFYA